MGKLMAFLAVAGVVAYFYVKSELTPAAASTDPAPRAHRYSADDVFYLRDYVSVRTNKGVVGWLPGQELSLSQSGPVGLGSVLVTDGTYTLAVKRSLLTHDLDEAAAIQAGDNQLQASVTANLAQDKTAADLRDAAANAYTAAGVNNANALQVAQNAVGNYQTRLNGDPRPTTYWGGSYGVPVYVGVPTREPRTSSSASVAATPAPFAPFSAPPPGITTTPAVSRVPTTPGTPMRAGLNPGFNPWTTTLNP